MVTTETELDQMAAALEAGANEYVMKPFTKDILVEKLQLAGIHSEEIQDMPAVNKRMLRLENGFACCGGRLGGHRRLVTHALDQDPR